MTPRINMADAKRASEMLRENLTYADAYAIAGSTAFEGRMKNAWQHFTELVQAFGCRVEMVPSPPLNLGPDDGLQHDARGDVVGR